MTGGERLAKVAEDLLDAQCAYCGHEAGEHSWLGPCLQDALQDEPCYCRKGREEVFAAALADRLDTFQAEDEARALREAAAEVERQGNEYGAEDKAAGCESRFCAGWLLGQTHAAQVLRDRADRIGGDA